MNKIKFNGEKFSYFKSLEFFLYDVFLLALITISLVDIPWLRSCVCIVFFYIPGYLLLKSIQTNNVYNPIESIIISFGLSFFIIIIITFISIKFDFLSFIIFVYFILTTFLLVIVILRKIKTDFSMLSQTNSFKSPLKTFFSFFREDKESLIIVFITMLFFFLGFFLRPFSVVRFPDEYYYLWASDINILTNLSYRIFPYMDIHLLISSTQKLGFILTLSFYFNLAGTTTGLAPHIISLLFYSMLLPVTYLIGSLHNKKTGYIATLFIACNPMIWLWNNRIMPDILYTVITISCFYFFYKSLKERGNIKWNYFVPAIIFGLLSYTQQPKMLFTWGIPFLIYFLSTAKSGKKSNRIIIFLIIIALILFLFLLIIILFFAPWFFQYDFPEILGNIFSIFHFNSQDWINFLSPGGTLWNNFAYPYYYSHAIILLVIIGTLCFAFKHTGREYIFVFLSIGMTLLLHATQFSMYDARFSFLIYPIFMVLAAIGFTTDLRLYSLLLVPFFYFLFPIFPLIEPGTKYFPQVLDLPRIISRLVAMAIIAYKILGGVQRFKKLSWKRSKLLSKFQFGKLVSVITIILVISSSFQIGTSIVTDDRYLYNDSINPEDVGIPQAGNWLIINAPTNSVIITNVRAHILSYYSNFKFDIENNDWIINREGVGKIITPLSEAELTEYIETRNFDYLVVFTKPVVGEPWKRPYFLSYIVDDTLVTIYEFLGDELNISESIY